MGTKRRIDASNSGSSIGLDLWQRDIGVTTSIGAPIVTDSPTALQRARELLAEASLQHTGGHLARACRLAAASIQQTEKGLRAFESQNEHMPTAASITNRLLNMKGRARKLQFACTDWIWNDRESAEID